MSDTTIGPDGLRDDERSWREFAMADDIEEIEILTDRLIESRAETEAEKRAHAETRATLDKWRTANLSDYYADGHYEQACDERDTWKARAEKAEAERDDLAQAAAELAEKVERLLASVAARSTKKEGT
jgi:hypothetical protein